eukprot:scaffold225641_cov30-Tisochrysis_lutea.AAC.1
MAEGSIKQISVSHPARSNICRPNHQSVCLSPRKAAIAIALSRSCEQALLYASASPLAPHAAAAELTCGQHGTILRIRTMNLPRQRSRPFELANVHVRWVVDDQMTGMPPVCVAMALHSIMTHLDGNIRTSVSGESLSQYLGTEWRTGIARASQGHFEERRADQPTPRCAKVRVSVDMYGCAVRNRPTVEPAPASGHRLLYWARTG